jgi:hypothetical protein
MTIGTPRPAMAGLFSSFALALVSIATASTVGSQVYAATANSLSSPLGAIEPPPIPAASEFVPGDTPFRFAEIPEIVFVRGYGNEQLGIFRVGTGNRWTPAISTMRLAGSGLRPNSTCSKQRHRCRYVR